AYYVDTGNRLSAAQDTLSTSVRQLQSLATSADQAVGRLNTDRFGPATIAGAADVCDAVGIAARKLAGAQAVVDAAQGAVRAALQKLEVHRGLEEATASAGAEAPAQLRRTHGQD
ncbi:MAG: hypothetical protein ACRDRZ_11000, partial [Pseudonocardiaceae bacterium]